VFLHSISCGACRQSGNAHKPIKCSQEFMSRIYCAVRNVWWERIYTKAADVGADLVG